jgi:hypothetical protein
MGLETNTSLYFQFTNWLNQRLPVQKLKLRWKGKPRHSVAVSAAVGHNISAGTATRYGLDGPGVESPRGGGGRQIFHISQNRPWRPSCLLCNEYSHFPGGKEARAWRWPPTSAYPKVKESVKKHLRMQLIFFIQWKGCLDMNCATCVLLMPEERIPATFLHIQTIQIPSADVFETFFRPTFTLCQMQSAHKRSKHRLCEWHNGEMRAVRKRSKLHVVEHQHIYY